MSGRLRGFTLIEILVAIVIIGIVMTIALLSVNLVSDDRGLRREAQRLISLLELAQDDALMQGREFGVEFTQSAYRFVEYDPVTNQWAEPLFDESLRLWQLSEEYEISLFIEDKQVQLEREPRVIESDSDPSPTREQYAPHLLIFSSGDFSPFELHVRRTLDNMTVAIQGDLLGNLEFVPDDEILR